MGALSLSRGTTLYLLKPVPESLIPVITSDSKEPYHQIISDTWRRQDSYEQRSRSRPADVRHDFFRQERVSCFSFDADCRSLSS